MSDNLSVAGKVKRGILRNIVSSEVIVNFLDIVLIPVDTIVLQKNGTLAFLDSENNLSLEIQRGVFIGNDVIQCFLVTDRSYFEGFA